MATTWQDTTRALRRLTEAYNVSSALCRTKGLLLANVPSSLDPIPPSAQPRPQILTSPPNIAQLTSSYNVADFQDIDTGVGRIPMVNATFIEAVAQSMGFQATDEDY